MELTETSQASPQATPTPLMWFTTPMRLFGALMAVATVFAGCGGRTSQQEPEVTVANSPNGGGGVAGDTGGGAGGTGGNAGLGGSAAIWSACLCNAGSLGPQVCVPGLKAGDACTQTMFTMCIVEYPSCFCCNGGPPQ
jgi:hypothetical protein